MLNDARGHFTVAGASLLVGVILALMAPVVEAQVVIYDDFNSPRIDENKWVGRQLIARAGGTGDLLEIQREITNAQALVLQARVVGGSISDNGAVSVENALAFRHARGLSEIVFDVAVRKLDVASCQGGSAASGGARGVFGLFDDGLGDVVADIGLSRSSPSGAPTNELEVTASLVHQTAEGETVLGFVSLGTAYLGQQIRLRMRWEPGRNRVRFQRDAEPLVTIDYANPVLGEPGRPKKYLAVGSVVPECAAAPARAAVVAAFDNVRVNP